VSPGGQPSLTLQLDDNLDRLIDVGVDGDTLRIGLRRGTSVSDATLQAAVTAPSLARIQGPGSSRIRLQDPLAGDDLQVELSGASRLDGDAELRSMTAGLSGASEVTLSGRVGSVSATASGASHLALERLEVDALEVELSGASNAEVLVRRTISASLPAPHRCAIEARPPSPGRTSPGGSSISRVR
jgi:hypothetical protein